MKSQLYEYLLIYLKFNENRATEFQNFMQQISFLSSSEMVSYPVLKVNTYYILQIYNFIIKF